MKIEGQPQDLAEVKRQTSGGAGDGQTMSARTAFMQHEHLFRAMLTFVERRHVTRCMRVSKGWERMIRAELPRCWRVLDLSGQIGAAAWKGGVSTAEACATLAGVARYVQHVYLDHCAIGDNQTVFDALLVDRQVPSQLREVSLLGVAGGSQLPSSQSLDIASYFGVRTPQLARRPYRLDVRVEGRLVAPAAKYSLHETGGWSLNSLVRYPDACRTHRSAPFAGICSLCGGRGCWADRMPCCLSLCQSCDGVLCGPCRGSGKALTCDECGASGCRLCAENTAPWYFERDDSKQRSLCNRCVRASPVWLFFCALCGQAGKRGSKGAVSCLLCHLDICPSCNLDAKSTATGGDGKSADGKSDSKGPVSTLLSATCDGHWGDRCLACVAYMQCTVCALPRCHSCFVDKAPDVGSCPGGASGAAHKFQLRPQTLSLSPVAQRLPKILSDMKGKLRLTAADRAALRAQAWFETARRRQTPEWVAAAEDAVSKGQFPEF